MPCIVLAVVVAACSGSGSSLTARSTVSPSPRATLSPTGLTPTPSQPPPSPSPSPSPTADASPIPLSISCPEPAAQPSPPLVLAESGDGSALVESFSDPARPTVVCKITGVFAPHVQFLSTDEVGITDGNAIERLKLVSGAQPVTVVTFPGEGLAAGFSPDGTSVAYLADIAAPDLGSGAANQLWLKVGDKPARALTPPIPLFGRDGSINDQLLVQFSLDGKYVLMVDTFVAGAAPASPDQAMMQVRSAADGSLVWVPPAAMQATFTKGGGPSLTMAAWSRSGDRVFYQDSSGVHVWDPSGTVNTLAAGLSWDWPSVAPDDSEIAYTVGITSTPSVEVRNIKSSTVTRIAGPRGWAVLLSATTMLEAHLVQNNQMGGPPYVPDAWFEWDLATGSETKLPAAAQNMPVEVLAA